MFNKKVQYYLGKYKIYELEIEERGLYKDKLYDHVLPEEYKELNFISNTYKEVLKLKNKIKFHSITNLKSSQVMCLNLFIPFMNEEYKHILIDVLNKYNVINTKSKIVDFVFEKEYVLEGKTCFDLYLKLEDNTQIFFEIKYTEDGFGRYSKTKTNVIETYYKKLFKESLNLNKYDLDNKHNIKFFEDNYQIFRNVSFVKAKTDHCVFLYPFKNYKCMKEINNFCEYSEELENIHTLDLEQFVECILEEVKDKELINYFKEFKMKYLNYEIEGIDVIDNTDIDYDFKENINNIIINCLDEIPLQPKGLYTINKKEDVKSIIEFLFYRIESLHDIHSFLSMIDGNATSRLCIYKNNDKEKILEYIQSEKLKENSLVYLSGDESNKVYEKICSVKNLNLGISAVDSNFEFISMYCKPLYNEYSKILTNEFGTLDNNDKIIEYVENGLEDKYFVFNTKGSPSVMYSCYKKDIKLDGNTFVIFDVETSGLNKTVDEILKIEAYKITDGVYKDSFSRIVKPKNKVSELIKKITNISKEELNNGIDIDLALKEFFEYINGCILISSNISFDFKLLFSNIEQYNKEILDILMSNTIRIVSLNNLINLDNCEKDLYIKSQKLLNVISDKWYKKFKKEDFSNIQTLNINIYEKRNDSKLYHEFIYNYDEEYLSELRIIQNYNTNITLDIIEEDTLYYKKNELGYRSEKVDKIIFLHETIKSMMLNNYKYKALYLYKYYNVIYNDMKFELKNDLTATFISCEKYCNTLIIPSEIKIKNKVYVVKNIDCESGYPTYKNIVLPHTIENIKRINFLYNIDVINNSNFQSIDGILYTKDKKELIKCGLYKKNKLVLDDELETINHLRSLSIEELVIGKNVSKIKTLSLFNLKTIIVHKDNKFFKSIDGVLYDKNCTKLIYYPSKSRNKSLTLPDSVKFVDEQIFSKHLKKLYIGKSFLLDNRELIFVNIVSLEHIEVSKENQELSSDDGILYSKDKSILVHYPRCKKNIKYIMPNSVKVLYGHAIGNRYIEELILSNCLEKVFYSLHCINLKSIKIKNKDNINVLETTNFILVDDVLYEKGTLHIVTSCNKNYIKIIDGVEYIDKWINTKKLDLPSTVKKIHTHMLDVEEIILNENNKHFCSLDGVLYSKDKRTLIHYPNEKKDKIFIVPDYVINIENFENKYLEEIIVGSNVVKIFSSACIGKQFKKIILPSKFKEEIEKNKIDNLEITYID